ncbi:voltage-dependent calcium channel subunit alpha-2/delta-3 isoform X3 [Anopheles merus]|uniref:voltage-dependent calcium channel subunit alpha-2/delta-3 isoform X3 n=1 Tax=Anopheles coluzzii TaxID=1518534 RepID=UPI001AAE0223|nr:voltage-dependent calcium channel subunit alpha-2/delta-3 isoform X3 [Anopheles coluzzii]XP_041769971.1 voltage-dependent calcium channel subunit alpha-2/delta-3 isoform X3 [Anopheles merus]XP_061499941.1 voltage-dependent calcium channel subunit alpha-2/delta-3 isoform X3 [Anopheles gambiae]
MLYTGGRSSCGILAFTFLLFFAISITRSADEPTTTIKYNVVQAWAAKLGGELWHLGDFITRRKEVEESFKQAQVVNKNGAKIVEEMAKDLKYMMDAKVSAVKRIMDTAENTAISFDEEPVNQSFQYYNAKQMIEPGEIITTPIPMIDEDPADITTPIPPKEIVLTKKRHFFNEAVNTTVSSVHVPTNVYDRATEVIKAIKWSEALDSIFYNNYIGDPTLTWQYFGSSSGFLRQFPATKWEQDPVDLYDCRLRSWYIEAANSPKDMLILVDSSGSMTGQRKDIAKHVVSNILDTLGPNDYVNIFTFSEEVAEVVPCFRDTLVQANMGNIRELKLGMDNIETNEIANVSAALTRAFELLEQFRETRNGARCNQAIMLVSDGVPYSFDEVFEQFNWKELPFIPVRVFTYLIGREVADVKEIKEMACRNQGYYVHLSTMAEVREEVLNYIPVIARPLVLNKREHPVVWSEIYADVEDPKMTDWLWEIKERAEQKERFIDYRKNRVLFYSPEEQHRRMIMKQRMNQDPYSNTQKYNFMTTVSVPVFDRRENANITEDILMNEAYWVTITRETRVANILGVAGADVPIAEIKKYLKPHLLGVNGYAFIVTNNGYILTHPDFRPVFQDILKPAYNTVDMIEVELTDDDQGPREFNNQLLNMRESIINQSTGAKWIRVKYHFDEMKRVSRTKRQYYWTPIKNTPFTLVVTYPETYGLNRLQIRTEDEIHRIHAKGSNVASFFTGNNWKIHPDWVYCKYLNEHPNETFATPELELKHFLERMKLGGWKWPSNRTPPPPEHAMFCDRGLMQALVYDAKVTEWFSKNVSGSGGNKDEKGPSPIAVLMGLLPRNEFKQRFGITVSFLATHSGLTRWQEYATGADESKQAEPDFSETHNRAIDEVWYKRAVELYYSNRNRKGADGENGKDDSDRNSFVYSVPFDAGNRNDTLVTASHAIFHADGAREAPVAVVGFQFHHSALYTLFKNITSQCGHGDPRCEKTCFTGDYQCYVIDNNGFVVISEQLQETGAFFGEVKPAFMQRLLDDSIFRNVTVYDYQAVCFMAKGSINLGTVLQTPLRLLWWLLTNTFSYLVWVVMQLFLSLARAYDEMYDTGAYDVVPELGDLDDPTLNRYKEPEFNKVLINRTRPEPCDHVITLYELNMDVDPSVYTKEAHQCERPYVVLPIPSSNLLLLVLDTLCPLPTHVPQLSTWPVEHDYNASLACHKARSDPLPRRRPLTCINKHANESVIELCGDGSIPRLNVALLLALLAFGQCIGRRYTAGALFAYL